MVSKYFNLMVSAGKSDSSDKNYGIVPYIFAFLSSIIWPLAWIYSNEHSINMAQTTIIRGTTSCIANYIICRVTQSDLTFKNGSTYKYIVIRSLILTVTSLFVGVSQFILPLSIVHTIISSSTLFVFIIDYLINSVVVNMKQAVGIVIGMLGVVLAVNGRFISVIIDPHYEEYSRFQNYITDNIYIIALFSLLFIIVIIFCSYAFVLTKHLNCNPFQLNYFLGLTSLFCGALTMQFIPTNHPLHTTSTDYNPSVYLKGIIFTGIPLLFDQWFLITALTMSKQSGIISMISFNSVIVAYLVSIFRYGELPNMFANVGVCLLLLGMYQTLFNITNKTDRDIENVSEDDDNQDGTFKRGIHKSMHTTTIPHPSMEINNTSSQTNINKNPIISQNNGKINDRLVLKHEVSISD